MNSATTPIGEPDISSPASSISKMGIKLAAFLIAIAPTMWASPSFSASRVFHDDFESGSLSQWSKDGSRALGEIRSSAFDGGTSRSGSRFAAFNWNGGDFSGVVLNRWDYNKEFFIRMWWRLDKDVDSTHGAKLMRLGWTGATSNVNELMIQRDGNFHQTWHVGNYENLAKNCWSGQNINDNQWHKIEIYVKDDSVNGVFKVWLDGKLDSCYPFTGKTSSGAKWYPLYMPSNWSMNPGWEHDSSNHFYVDDVEIFSDSTQGVAITGSMADATIKVTGSASAPVMPNPPLLIEVR